MHKRACSLNIYIGQSERNYRKRMFEHWEIKKRVSCYFEHVLRDNHMKMLIE